MHYAINETCILCRRKMVMQRMIQSSPSWRQRCESSLPCLTWRAFRSLCAASLTLLASLQKRCASQQALTYEGHARGNPVKAIVHLASEVLPI